MVDVSNEIKDFSKSLVPVRFRINDDIFEAHPTVPANVMIKVMKTFESVDEKNPDLDAFVNAFKFFLVPKSFTLLKKRLDDYDNPIDFEQLNKIIMWLMEEYGLRPPESASP